ncbi:MAG: hypothetical protein JJU36_09490 [Phycisphaeraceae bacterium]|nr:hypothetical protein [Phycisphaeraceae bacterium]
MKIQVDAAKTEGPFVHFWRSTGYTPARWVRRVDMRQQIDYFGMIPFDGVTYVRIHYMLNLVRGSGFHGESPDIDWTHLDELLDALRENGLKPFFELMGGPVGYFDNFEIDEQAHAWRRFCRLLAERYIERYGREEVISWYFETWNEPDLSWWKQSDLAFHRYWDACANGVKDADPKIRFGGPGTARYMSERLTSILKHLDTGKDIFTGGKPKVDFISVHEKGSQGRPEDLYPDMKGVVEREADLVNYIRKHHPSLADVPIMNNECDPQVGWKEVHSWRGKPYYAGLIVRTVNDHLRRLVNDMGAKYELLGNDNGFAGVWGQRTHLARFGSDTLLEDGYVEQIKKPAHHAMTLLAMLGDERLAASTTPETSLYGDLGVMATRRGEGQVAVMVYHSRDAFDESGTATIDLAIKGLGFNRGSVAHYRIDQHHTNPMAVWLNQREHELPGPPRPEHIGPKHAPLFKEMRLRQELELIDGPRTFESTADELSLNFDLPMPGVSLVLVSQDPGQAPPAPPRIWARRYFGLTGEAQALIRWIDSDSRVIKTYEVFFTPAAGGEARRINEPDLVCRGFLHVADDVRGTYKVRAVDHWGRSSDFSQSVEI